MDKKEDDKDDKKKVKVTLIWGGTGASKEVNVDFHCNTKSGMGWLRRPDTSGSNP